MTKDSQLLSLASKLKSSCDDFIRGEVSEQVFEKWVESYLARIHEVRTDMTNNYGIHSNDQFETADQEWRQWASSQQVVEWLHAKRLIVDKKSYWWMCPQGNEVRTGYFRGCHRFTGQWKITNGVDLWIEREDGEVMKGHLDNFLKYPKPRKSKEPSVHKKVQELLKKGKNEKLREQLMELLK